MRAVTSSVGRYVRLLCALVVLIPSLAVAQTAAQTPSRIVAPVDESALTVLKGNVYPLATAKFDRGAAPDSLPMERMLLVLKRSPEQERALQALLDQQQDKSSPNYHQWLTPEAFGKQFGISDQDLQAVTGWLTTHGFQVTQVSKGRSVIEFRWIAAQVREAFHTSIHQYSVNGELHWANASDPQIPNALTPVVAGVWSLHNFEKKPNLVRSKETFHLVKHPGFPRHHLVGCRRARCEYPAGGFRDNRHDRWGGPVGAVHRRQQPGRHHDRKLQQLRGGDHAG